ncbi:MAG: hypothetical protein JST22_00505 [Bacteroidetes bacterium]|nr:hypothetical protein [Bacteroidota bacterium]
MVSRSNRCLMLAMAVVAIVAATLCSTPAARAQCCGFGIGNGTGCTFRVKLTTPGGDTVFAVPPPGGSWTIPNCDPFRLSVVDACGNLHGLPTVVGTCIDVYFGPGCCVQFCKVDDCRWVASPAHCVSCV